MQIITPANEQEWLELRTKDITSTEIGCLFGISPYCTAYELWWRKKEGNVVRIEDNERMKWGRKLQDVIANTYAEENNLSIRRMNEYIRDENIRAGSSFDYAMEDDGLIEVKNVDGLVFHNEWTEEEAPLHIEIQCQHELLVSQKKRLVLLALVGGNRIVEIKRTPDEKVQSAITAKVAEFWKSIDDNTPPPPNMEIDAEFIAKMYNYSEPGKVITLEDEDVKAMALRYKEAGDKAKELETVRDAIKAELLIRIGDAEKVLGNGFSISAGMVGPTHIEYDRAGYRNFRINFKKEK